MSRKIFRPPHTPPTVMPGAGPASTPFLLAGSKSSRETPRGAPLSHHRAYGSRTTAVPDQVERGVMAGHRSQSQRLEPRDGHRLFDLRGISQAPPPFAGRSQLDGADPRHTMTHQKVDHGADALAALQPHASQLATEPSVEVAQRALALGVAIVRHPTRDEAVHLLDHPFQ